MTDLHVIDATAVDAVAVTGVIHHAFSSRRVLDPPSTALSETPHSVAVALAEHGGLLATIDGRPAGAMLFAVDGDALRLRRVSVDPRFQGRGVASAMVGCAEEVAVRRGLARVRRTARSELPETVEFWRRRGYSTVRERAHGLVLAKAMPVELTVPTAAEMRALGVAVAAQVRAGDGLVLCGDLGAGKTTFTQGLGAGLGVRGGVTSPTFVISRVHPSPDGGPALVHVDAYRLGGFAELDALDLDASLDEAVTVVEWGHGLAEGLAGDRLDITMTRGDDEADEVRQVRIVPVGPRWADAGLRLAGSVGAAGSEQGSADAAGV
jgi:tRNA threonylcarbamoyladenosine biosynthesis protein TsaE